MSVADESKKVPPERWVINSKREDSWVALLSLKNWVLLVPRRCGRTKSKNTKLKVKGDGVEEILWATGRLVA